jgi:tRNA1Val (adenine37-N6)-methyltransferase
MFRFKQFSVAHDKCAMKVNTDGVLLGAWASSNQSDFSLTAGQILDIGTGTGVIALMMAQQFHNAKVDAIDIDEGAYLQAKENFEQSMWNERLKAFHSPLQTYQPDKQCEIIVSNPPYFIDDLKTTSEKKNLAKHSTGLSYEELANGVETLLEPKGKVFIALPFFNLELVKQIFIKRDLFVERFTAVRAVAGKNPYLALIQLQRQQTEPAKDEIVIQNNAGNFTEQYRALTKDFYLKF